MLITCITSTTLIEKAKEFTSKKFDTESINVIDIKDLIFQPSYGLTEIFRKKDLIVAFLQGERFVQAIDLIIFFWR